MGQKVNIPSQNQPFRRQASIGGNVSFRNIGDNNDNSFIALAKVTRVYYQRGKLDFKLTNTNSLVADRSGNGSGSAPIPVDFFGRRKNGQVFGHYRPVKIGDLIAVAYVNGHKSSPIVIGVYPNSGQDYEIISPSLYLDGDDEDAGVAETALAEQKIYPSMQLEYRSGSGTIAKALNGHSFLTVDDETSHQYDKLWQNYDTVGFFHNSSDAINPLKETAGDWLLVHEDNPLSDDGDNHRTRFFVNKKGEIQIVLMDNTSAGTISVLEGSKQDGFTISQYYDLQAKKSGDLSDDVYEPDFKSATNYVSLNVGKDQEIALEVAAKNSSKLELKSDGLYLNGKPFVESLNQRLDDLSDNIKKDIHQEVPSNSDFKELADSVSENAQAARDAAESARQAGESAKDAGLAAEKAGEDAKETGDDIKSRIIYYSSISKEKDVAIPGKYIIINTDTYIANGTIKNAYIEDGAIDHAKIANEAVGSSQIEDAAITRAKIANLAVGSAQIEDASITNEKVGKLSFDHMIGATLDAGKINVINLTAESIKADTITANKLKIGQLSDITGDAGQITDGKIIVKGNGSNSGVSLEGLDADNPDVYTPSKKAALANIVHAIESSAEASLDYAKQVGLSNDPVAIDLQNKYDAMVDGLAPIFNDMGVSTNFDHNTVEQLTSDCNNAIDKFQNLANSQLNRKIGQTADNKNSVYQGYEQPANPQNNDIWFQENSDGTYQIRVYDGGSWISPGMKDIKEVQESVSTLPRSYYSYTQPTGTDYKDGDIWYKTSTDTTNNTVVYTAYKWNSNTNTWDPLLDATSSHNYVGSAPVNPINGDFWMDNTTLKQYQNGDWKTIPTQGPQGIPGADGTDGKTYYTWIKYATDSSGSNISDSPTGMSYIGIAYNKGSQTESSTPTDYKWTKIKGEQGIPGKPGADGKTSYFHIAYANSADGKDGFYVGGGQNLLPGTRDFEQWSISGTKVAVTNGQDQFQAVTGTNSNAPYYDVVVFYGIPLEKDTDYTASFWAKTSEDTDIWSFLFDSGSNGNYADGATVNHATTDYTRFVVHFHNGNNNATPNFIPARINKPGVTVWVYGCMLEKGTIAHNWSPAPSEAHPLYMGTYTDYTRAGSTDPTNYTWVPMFDSTKKRNFTTQPTTPYAVGDTWTESGATYFCTTARDSGAFRRDDWTMQQLTIQSLAPSVTNSLYNDNLLLGTGNDLSVTGTNTSNQTIHNYLLTNGYNVSSLALALGTQFTISFDWSVSGSSPSGTFNAQWSDVPWDLGPTVTVSSSNTSGHISNTFSVSTDSKNVANTMGFRLDNFVGTLTVSNMKLEKGTVATPWCLSQSELTTTTRDYRGVTLNDKGLTATAGSTTVAMNSNDGFLIKNKADGEVFHVDTNGNLNMKGNITAGNISGVNFTGNNLTLNNSLQVINGSISANNGNFAINSNGLTIKDGGLKIVNGNNETTTEIKDDGTFSTNKGFFSGTIKGSNIILNNNDGSVITANGGVFKVDDKGNVTATSINITGNRKDDVSNQALIKGANITDGNIIKGNLIEGNDIIGNRIQSSEFMTSTHEYSIGSYYPISGSIYTPSFLIEDSGNISVHTVFPQAFSTVARIGSNKGVDGPYVNITHEAFDRNTLSGSFGYGKGYEYPVPYLYGHQGGMVEYPVNSKELSIVYMNDISRSEYNGYGLYDGYKYTEIATINDIVQKYKSKIGRIKFNFGIVCTYGSYDTSEGTTVAGGDHDLYVVLTTGRINENDTYHVDFDGKTFNNVKNNIKIKMTSKKVLTGVGGLSYYNLYAELSTKDLDLANTYYLGVLQKGFIKDSRESLANHTWKIQIDEMAIVPESDILDDQGYCVPTAGGSYRDLTISANGSIITHEDDIGVQTTSEYNSRYLSFAVSTDGQSPMPYWTTINADGIGFSIGNKNSSTDGSGNPNGLATRQCIYFSGDTNQNGMSMDNFGNIHAQVGSYEWEVHNNQGDKILNVPFDPNGTFNFNVPTSGWGGLKIGWVKFDDLSWAGRVPAIYTDSTHLTGIAMWDRYIVPFVDGWAWNMTDKGLVGNVNTNSHNGKLVGTHALNKDAPK